MLLACSLPSTGNPLTSRCAADAHVANGCFMGTHPHLSFSAPKYPYIWNPRSGVAGKELLERRKDGTVLLNTSCGGTADLASTYWKQGRHTEAEKLGLEVLEQQRKVLGMEHPDTIEAAANLAWTYLHQGRYREAEKLELEVLERKKGALGLEHPKSLTQLYEELGKLTEAEETRKLLIS